MTLPVWQGLAAQTSGDDIVKLESPSVTVTDRTTGAQPSLFSDRDGNNGIGNPFTANADGSIEFYVASGRYKVEATKGGETVTWDNQLIGTVHGAEHLWKLATVEIITVAGNASSPQDDAYSADLGGNLSADDTFIGRIANRNETTTPTFENTGGTPGALTITAYDGRPLWPGALEGDHRFQYEAGTSPETWVVHDPREMGVVDPEHATDGSSPTNDEYVSARNTTPPADGQRVTRDFRTANETPTPTLDGKTMTTRDGSALWASAVSGVHDVQYDSGADTYLVLEPRWQLAPFWAGHIDGLELSNGTDADHDIDIATGVCSMRDGSGNRKLFELTSGLTKQIDADWAEGTDAGGFPSGLTLSADTWYRAFLIGKDDGSVDAGFDTDSDATNLLSDASDYSWFRRVGWVLTDGSSNIIAFSGVLWSGGGLRVAWAAPVNDLSTTSPSTTSANVTMSAPPNSEAKIQAILRESDTISIYVRETSTDDNAETTAANRNTLHCVGTATRAQNMITLLVDASSQIAYNSDLGTVTEFSMAVHSFIDARRG